jgi:hypothetical protein
VLALDDYVQSTLCIYHNYEAFTDRTTGKHQDFPDRFGAQAGIKKSQQKPTKANRSQRKPARANLAVDFAKWFSVFSAS